MINILDLFRKDIDGMRMPSKVMTRDGGSLDLAKKEDALRFKKIVIDLQRSTDALAQRDLKEWRRANQLAIYVANPNRSYLYDIYRDVDLDLHLSGCVEQLQGFVMSKSFKLTKTDGEPDRESIKYFDTEWFKQLLRYILAQRYWGHSLIELGDIVTREDGMMTFDGVTLIPRKHVIPEYGRIVKNVGDGWQSGISYREKPYSDWLIEVGAKDDLGLYLKAAIETIPKKYALAFWDSFAEMFGLPIRVAKTASRDSKDFDKLGKMMENMGSKAWAVLPSDSEIELKESSRGDAYNVYDKRIDRANTELSKLVLLTTMTIEDGSSLSQSQTHLKVLQNLIYEIADQVRDVVNNQLLPKMVRLGFPLKGLTFDWDEPVDYTPEQQVSYETMLLNNFDVDGSYFADKYGIPLGERRSAALPDIPEADTKQENSKGGGRQQNARGDFFD